MLGWLLYDRVRLARNKAYASMHEQWCGRHGVELKVMLAEDVSILYGHDGPRFAYGGSLVTVPDFAVVRCEAPDHRRALERAGVFVSNAARIGELANDKLRTYELAYELGVPFMEVQTLAQASTSLLDYPMVIKPRRGHGGQGVRLVHTPDEFGLVARAYADDNDEWLVQRVGPVRGKDLRVYVVGTDAVAAMLRTAAPGELRSNFCLGGSASVYELGKDELALVDEFVHALGPGCYAVDFLFNQGGGLLFNEVEDVAGSRMLYAQTSVDMVDLHLSWVLSQL